MKPTKDQKLKRDEAIAIVWNAKKSEWIMKDLALIFNLHIDTIYSIIKNQRERKIIVK